MGDEKATEQGSNDDLDEDVTLEIRGERSEGTPAESFEGHNHSETLIAKSLML